MLKSYAAIALRNLRKHVGYTFINVTGLALGVACSLLIFLFVKDELSYDRFNEKADRIYRITVTSDYGNQSNTSLMAPVNMGQHLVSELPGVVAATKIRRYASVLMTHEGEPFYQEGVFGADSTFFDVFDFGLRWGNAKTALAQPHSVVLTASLARKFFGDQNPVGQTLTMGASGTEYTVTAVADDPPHNSHLRFQMLLSFTPSSLFGDPNSWMGGAYPTYLVLDGGTDPALVETGIEQLEDKYLQGQAAEHFSYALQPLTSIHLHSHLPGSEVGENGDIRYVYLFSTVALLVLLLGCINYMNLATARSVKRAREVGVRKVLGAQRSHLIRQFMGESLLMSLLAVVLGIALVELLLPAFNGLVDKQIEVVYLGHGSILPLLAGVVVAVGLVAGSYPALVLSTFRPVSILSQRAARGRGAAWLRKGLVVFQFTISVALIIATIVVQRQLEYVQHKRLGFDKEHVVRIDTRAAVSDSYGAFVDALAALPHVQSVSATHLPGMSMTGPAFPEGMEAEAKGIMSNLASVDANFLKTMGITLMAGRNFDPAMATDAADAVLVNEAAVRAYGWNDPLGKTLRFTRDDTPRRVIGVVADYNYMSLKEEIAPLVLELNVDRVQYAPVAARIDGSDLPGTIAALGAVWKRFAPGRPFEYQFMDDAFDAYFQSEQRLGRIFGAFTLFAIVVACLGLFGLAAFTAEQRRKEIGVRKVMGATVAGIVALLSKDFLRLVALSFALSIPIAYYGMHRWLEDFAYRTEISWQIFLVAGSLALAVALLTVGYQAIKAALADPVKALRHE